MTWKPPATDLLHDMYQPTKRAQKFEPATFVHGPHGTQAEKEAWMRERQAQGKGTRMRAPKIEAVITLVCFQFGVTRGQILGRSRSHNVVQARSQTCRELRKLDLSYPEIARALNFREHSAVMYHCQKDSVTGPTPRDLLRLAQTSVNKAIRTQLYAERLDALYDAIEHIRATVKLIQEQEEQKKCQ